MYANAIYFETLPLSLWIVHAREDSNDADKGVGRWSQHGDHVLLSILAYAWSNERMRIRVTIQVPEAGNAITT